MSFVKDNGIWYVDLPNWTLERSHLAMVAGADTLLDEMSNNKKKITVNVSILNKPPMLNLLNKVVLKLIMKDFGGVSGSYAIISKKYVIKELWLCPVVSFVFGKLPKYIIINKLQ